MNKVIQAIVIDGFHKGHVVRMPYYPTIKLLKPTVIMVDTCCDDIEMAPEHPKTIEYKECFRAVDQDIVLYSTTGKSEKVLEWFTPSLTTKYWRPDTILYYGYHDGYLRREDGAGTNTDYEDGFRRGMEEAERRYQDKRRML